MRSTLRGFTIKRDTGTRPSLTRWIYFPVGLKKMEAAKACVYVVEAEHSTNPGK